MKPAIKKAWNRMDVDWQTLGSAGTYTLATILCLGGFVLSCLSLSGTWLVLGAAALVAWHRWPLFPGWTTLAIFLILCIGVEVVETMAGTWGVQKRGGSKAAGWAAFGGGLLGMVFGGVLIPLPIVGSLIGMMAGSFACAFLVENAKMKKAEHAAHVAAGAVLARVAVVFLKVGVTVLMACALAAGIILT